MPLSVTWTLPTSEFSSSAEEHQSFFSSYTFCISYFSSSLTHIFTLEHRNTALTSSLPQGSLHASIPPVLRLQALHELQQPVRGLAVEFEREFEQNSGGRDK